MTTQKYKLKKSKIFSKKNKKTKSIQMGGDKIDVKLAILFITTHGNIDPADPEIVNDTGINVRKINARSDKIPLSSTKNTYSDLSNISNTTNLLSI